MQIDTAPFQDLADVLRTRPLTNDELAQGREFVAAVRDNAGIVTHDATDTVDLYKSSIRLVQTSLRMAWNPAVNISGYMPDTVSTILMPTMVFYSKRKLPIVFASKNPDFRFEQHSELPELNLCLESSLPLAKGAEMYLNKTGQKGMQIALPHLRGLFVGFATRAHPQAYAPEKFIYSMRDGKKHMGYSYDATTNAEITPAARLVIQNFIPKKALTPDQADLCLALRGTLYGADGLQATRSMLCKYTAAASRDIGDLSDFLARCKREAQIQKLQRIFSLPQWKGMHA